MPHGQQYIVKEEPNKCQESLVYKSLK